MRIPRNDICLNDTLQLLKVSSISDLNSETKCYRLVHPEGKPLASFVSGQFINIFYKIGCTVTSRPYSIASSPLDAELGFYDLYIHVNGEFTSTWLGSNICVGDQIYASVPLGHFTWNETYSRKVVGISGGLSLTPLISMAKAIYQGELDFQLILYCGWDNPEQAIAVEELTYYSDHSNRIQVNFLFESNPPIGCFPGLITSDFLHAAKLDPVSTFFCCGPQEMYDEIRCYMEAVRLSTEQVHFEVPGEIHDVRGLPVVHDTFKLRVLGYPNYSTSFTHLISVEPTDEIVIPVNGTESVLKNLERAGILTKARCRSGDCKCCVVRLVKGEVYVPESRMDADGAELGLIRLCSSFAVSDLVIDFA